MRKHYEKEYETLVSLPRHENVIRLFEELEEARNSLTQIQTLIEDMAETKNSFGECL